MTTPSNATIIAQYLKDRETIRLVRSACQNGLSAFTSDEVKLVAGTLKNGGLTTLETYQANREAHLLQQEDPACFDFLTDLYLNGRDGKATAEAKKKDIGIKQDQIEKWLLKMLDKLGSKGFKTESGTVFPTRKESVGVEDWDAFLESEILKPMAEALFLRFASGTEEGGLEEELLAELRSSAHFDFLNKAVNKTAVLERMGDQDEKDHSRPNPPPAGVKYSAIRTVGVRKA